MNEFEVCKVCSFETRIVNSKFNLVECINCKLTFCNNIYSENAFIEVYDRLYNQTKQYNVHVKESEKLIAKKKYKLGYTKKIILDYILRNNVKKIAEIGAGVGVVAHYLQNKEVDYLGIELDVKTAERAKKASLNIIQGDFKIINNIDEKFNCILAFEVIEHIQALDDLFKIIKHKLHPNGYLGFTVPNYNKRLNYKEKHQKIYQSPPPIHLNFFTIESLRNIAIFYGFKVEFINEKKFPYLNLNKIETYKHFLKALMGNYNGSTIIALFQKNETL